MIDFTFVARAIQLVFALIVLGLTAYGKISSSSFYFYKFQTIMQQYVDCLVPSKDTSLTSLLTVTSNFDDAPGEINFMLFTAIWTLLIVPFLMFAQKFFPKLAHPFVTLALEFLTMLFWFAAFISVAVWVDDFFCAGNDVCGSSKAAAAFGAFIW